MEARCRRHDSKVIYRGPCIVNAGSVQIIFPFTTLIIQDSVSLSKSEYGSPLFFFGRRTAIISALFPGSSDPVSLPVPSAAAPPVVASVKIARALTPSLRSTRYAYLISSHRFRLGELARLSVPSPTIIPASRNFLRDILPTRVSLLLRGQWATGARVFLIRRMSLSVAWTACTARKFLPSRPGP